MNIALYTTYTVPYPPTSDGFDDDAIDDELGVDDLEENQLMECYEDLDEFPYGPNGPPGGDDEKKKFIFDLMIRLSQNPDILFGVDIPKCSVHTHSLTLSLSMHSMDTLTLSLSP